jgi:hypothetical protein
LTDQAEASLPLSSVVADVAAGAALALRDGGGPYALSLVFRPGNALAPAAVRVLGADALAPYALGRGERPSKREDAQVVREALTTFAPGADASEVSKWSYRGLVEAAHAFLPADGDAWPSPPEADNSWTGGDPWPRLAHRASQLAALALPGLVPDLAEALAERTEDLARGFVRAVRRRDWLQAAGVGRWLAGFPDVPPTLGLERGLAFVGHMSGGDSRVSLNIMAARHVNGRRR